MHIPATVVWSSSALYWRERVFSWSPRPNSRPGLEAASATPAPTRRGRRRPVKAGPPRGGRRAEGLSSPRISAPYPPKPFCLGLLLSGRDLQAVWGQLHSVCSGRGRGPGTPRRAPLSAGDGAHAFPVRWVAWRPRNKEEGLGRPGVPCEVGGRSPAVFPARPLRAGGHGREGPRAGGRGSEPGGG